MSDVASNDAGMKAKLDEAFSELSGMVRPLETHCNNSVGEFKSSIIGAIDPKFEQLRQQMMYATGATPGLEHAAKVVENESFSKEMAKRVELLEASVIQMRTTTGGRCHRVALGDCWKWSRPLSGNVTSGSPDCTLDVHSRSHGRQ